MGRGVEIGRGYIEVDTEDGAARSALSSFSSFAATAFKATAVAVATVAAAAVKVGIEFNSMKEQAAVAFTTLLGSGEAAQKMLGDLQKFAASTPFELEGLISNARNLLGVGVAADRVIPILTAMGNAAGALGIKQEAFDRIMLATTQSMAKGKIQGEELLQFAENGIPIFDLLGKALGIPKDQIAKLASDGKLLADETLPLLFDQMQKDYGGAMAAQSKTLAGTWSSLKDNAKILTATGLKPVFDVAKQVVGAIGELAGSDKATTFAQKFAASLDTGIDKLKAFGNQLKLRFRDEAADVFEVVSDRARSFSHSVSEIADDVVDALGKVADRVLPELAPVVSNLSGLLGPALRAAAGLAQDLSDNADGIGEAVATAAGIVGTVGGTAFSLFGTVLEVVAKALGLVLDLVGALPGPVGSATAAVLIGVAAWRLLGGSIADVTKVLTVFSTTGAAATGLRAVASRIDDAALAAAGLTEKLTGSSKAGIGVVNAGTAISGTFTGLAGILPALGGALLAVGAIFTVYALQQNEIRDSAKGLAQGLSEGGQKARDSATELGRLKTELAGVQRAQDAWTGSMEASAAGADDVYGGQLGDKVFDLRNRVSEVDTQFNELVATLGPVEAAQARYNRAVAEYGPGSREATAASGAWRDALADEKLKNEQAAAATKTHLDKLLELQAAQLAMLNTDIGYRQSLSQLETAHARVADAVTRTGAGSKEHRDALLAEEQAFVGVIDAAGRRAAAQVASQGPEAQATAALAAQNKQALELIATMGNSAPESLKRFVANMDGAARSALDATNRTGAFNRVVIDLPDGKTITLAVDPQTGKVIDFSNAVNAIVNRRDVELRVIVTSSGDVRALDALGRPSNALAARAIGGWTPPGAVLVGENGPEIRFEDRSSYIATAAQSRRLMAGAGSEAGVTINMPISAPDLPSAQLIGQAAADQVMWRVGR